MCQALLRNPFPEMSPGFLSFFHVYNGLPLKAHCLLPSSRVMIV